MTRIEEIEKRLAECTPGFTMERVGHSNPDSFSYEFYDYRDQNTKLGHLRFVISEMQYPKRIQAKFDAALIAHAPEDLRFLLDRIAEMEKQYISAVKGRADFRDAYRKERNKEERKPHPLAVLAQVRYWQSHEPCQYERVYKKVGDWIEKCVREGE
jgi:hypothetical protein